MKKLFVTLCLVAVAIMAKAQSCDIPMQVVVSDEIEGMTAQSANYLTNVLNRVLVSGQDVVRLDNSQFGVVVNADVVNKHIIAGAPQKTVLNLVLSLYMGDVRNGQLFSSFSMEVNGVGDNYTKAFNNAIRQLSGQNRGLADFVSKGKRKVIAWYNDNYQNIIRQARVSASMKNFESALYELLSVPQCCVGYDAAMADVLVVYQQYVDRMGEENLAQAQAAWMSGFTPENAAIAAAFLAEIYPDAACYKQAQALVKEIKSHMGEEWQFKLKQWSDRVSIESQRLTNAKEIALAYAQNQPNQVVHLLYR